VPAGEQRAPTPYHLGHQNSGNRDDTRKRFRATPALSCAELDRLHNGVRPEKRKAVAALEQARRALYQQAHAHWERSQ
jgi:hypothetical protein